MSGRISLPIRSVNGSLKMTEKDEDNDVQSIIHHVETLPASHVMTRMLGSDIKYNVTIQTAMQSIYAMRMNTFRYESNDIISEIHANLSGDGNTLNVEFRWKTNYVGTLG